MLAAHVHLEAVGQLRGPSPSLLMWMTAAEGPMATGGSDGARTRADRTSEAP